MYLVDRIRAQYAAWSIQTKTVSQEWSIRQKSSCRVSNVQKMQKVPKVSKVSEVW